MPVTPRERALANRMDREQVPHVNRGIRVASVFGPLLTRAVVQAFASIRGDPLAVLRARILGLAAFIRDAMVTGHLLGVRRAQIAFPADLRPISLATTDPYRETIRFLKRRAGLTTATLASLTEDYGVDAVLTMRGVSEGAERAVAATLARITEEGLHVRDGKIELRKTLLKQGLSPAAKDVAPYRLEAIFRTQTQLAYAAGRHEAEQDAAVQEILWGYKYVTVGDDRVRPTHAALEGVTLPKNHSFWEQNTPPNGWNCRCQIISIFEERPQATPPASVEVDGRQVAPGADTGFGFHPLDLNRRRLAEPFVQPGRLPRKKKRG